MANQYSVVYDTLNKEPFAIIRMSGKSKFAFPVQKSAEHWAVQYNSGTVMIPQWMTKTEFVEMDCNFVESFKTAFNRDERVKRRAEMLLTNPVPLQPTEIVYGAGNTKPRRRPNAKTRKVMPVISHLQRDLFRSRAIEKAIRTGRRWLKKNEA